MKLTTFGYRFELAKSRPRTVLPEPRTFLKPDQEASKEFWAAFQIGGTLVSQCSCGRTHFCCNTTLDWETGELETLLENTVKYPEKFICDHVDDSLAVWDSPMGNIVWGCPCFASRRFEVFLITYQRSVLDYYRRRLELKRHAVGDLSKAVEEAS